MRCGGLLTHLFALGQIRGVRSERCVCKAAAWVSDQGEMRCCRHRSLHRCRIPLVSLGRCVSELSTSSQLLCSCLTPPQPAQSSLERSTACCSDHSLLWKESPPGWLFPIQACKNKGVVEKKQGMWTAWFMLGVCLSTFFLNNRYCTT